MSHWAVVFPGQGSQQVGMLQELAHTHPLILETFAQASDYAQQDLWQLTQSGPEDKLNLTQNTQLVMLVADVALFRVLTSQVSLPIACMAGHSLGEYAALVCANALSLKEAMTLVGHRARIMQAHVPEGQGAMAAIVGLSDYAVRSICLEVSSIEHKVTPANFNAIGQVVIAGHTLAVERALIHAEAQGAKLAKRIPVSVPCHCPLLENAAQDFKAYLDKTSFKSPELTVLSNVDVSAYQSDTHIKTLLAEQLYQPVRWVETVLHFKQLNITHVIECGPGAVLSGLIKRIDKTLKTFALSKIDTLEHLAQHFN